jgi:hypothetical protein
LPSKPLSTIVRKDILPLRGTTPCNKCAEFLELGFHNTYLRREFHKKKDLLDPLADDDDIDYLPRSPQLLTRLKALVIEFIDIFATKVRRAPTAVEPMKIVVNKDKWYLPCNRDPPRKYSEEKQKEIRKQVDALMILGVIKESQATEWSLLHLVPKPTP